MFSYSLLKTSNKYIISFLEKNQNSYFNSNFKNSSFKTISL